jgi:DNA (cytosine-5)-methyltransferase 3A
VNVLSLFDGISAARVALERAGIKVDRYYASEIKPHAIKITQAMYPDTIQLGDVTRIDFATLPPIDLIIFGSPCQDLSCANSEQKGLEGARSGLFYKAVEAIRICKPRWFLMENVASMKPGEKEKISRTLGEFYTNDLLAMYCEPVRINSSLVSAQMRDRLYWCNWNVSQPKDKGILLQDILEQGGDALNEKSYALLANYGVGYSGNRQHELVGMKQRAHGFNKGGLFTDKTPSLTAKSLALTANYGKMNEKNYAKGQGQLVSIALKDKAPRVSTEAGGFTNYSKEHGYVETQDLIIDVPESYSEHDKAYALTASYGKKAGIADHVKNCAELIKVGNIKNDSISCRVYSPEGKAATLNANGEGQGAKTGLYFIGNIESNAANPNRMGRRVYDPSGKAAAVLSPQTGGNNNENYKIGENVRKLTPRECCRLQTYDERVFDLFTMRRKEGTPERPYVSNSAFYNVFGDSFTVDVIVHILQCNKEMMGQWA